MSVVKLRSFINYKVCKLEDGDIYLIKLNKHSFECC